MGSLGRHGARSGLLLAFALLEAGCRKEPEAPPRTSSVQSQPSVPGQAAPDARDLETLEEPAPPADLSPLETVVASRPDDPRARRSLASALARADRTDEALGQLERALRLAPQDPENLLEVGVVYASMRRDEEAQRSYERLLELVPGQPRALNNLGNLALRHGDVDRAVAYYRKAVASDPGYVAAWHRMADALKFYGRDDEAYEAFQKILSLPPRRSGDQALVVDSLCQIASLELARGAPEKAEALLARALEEAPSHPSAHYTRAQALTRLGREEEARRELEIHMKLLSMRHPTSGSATSQ